MKKANISEEYIDSCEEIRIDLQREYMSDLIALLEEVPDLLNLQINEQDPSKERSKEQRELEEILKEHKMDFSDRDAILCQANNYAEAAELDGYRRGFRMAMRLCMAGLGG